MLKWTCCSSKHLGVTGESQGNFITLLCACKKPPRFNSTLWHVSQCWNSPHPISWKKQNMPCGICRSIKSSHDTGASDVAATILHGLLDWLHHYHWFFISPEQLSMVTLEGIAFSRPITGHVMAELLWPSWRCMTPVVCLRSPSTYGWHTHMPGCTSDPKVGRKSMQMSSTELSAS